MCTFACVWEEERIGFPPHLTWAGFFVIFIYFILVMPGEEAFSKKDQTLRMRSVAIYARRGPATIVYNWRGKFKSITFLFQV